MIKKNEEELSNIFKALSDPNRIKIIRILTVKNKEMTCGELSSYLSLSLSTVSYHFKILRHAGLTKMRKKGHEKYLSLNNELIDALGLKKTIN